MRCPICQSGFYAEIDHVPNGRPASSGRFLSGMIFPIETQIPTLFVAIGERYFSIKIKGFS